MSITLEQAKELEALASQATGKFRIAWEAAVDVGDLVDESVDLPDAPGFYTARRRRKIPEGGGYGWWVVRATVSQADAVTWAAAES